MLAGLGGCLGRLSTVMLTRCVVPRRCGPAAAGGQRGAQPAPAGPAPRAHRAAAAAAEAAAPEDPDGAGADQDAAGGASATGNRGYCWILCERLRFIASAFLPGTIGSSVTLWQD